MFLGCCFSVFQLCLTLCDPIDCSMPGLPVPHHLPEFAQVHVHCISDAVQPSHPLMPSSPSAHYLSQCQGFFQLVVCSHQVTKILELQHILPVNIQGSSPAPQFESINSLVFCLLYDPVLKNICDCWEVHSLDYMDLFQQSNVSAFQHTV